MQEDGPFRTGRYSEGLIFHERGLQPHIPVNDIGPGLEQLNAGFTSHLVELLKEDGLKEGDVSLLLAPGLGR